MVNRCRWVPTDNKLYCDYHDKEWGKPIGDDEKLFELLCLESYQSGLSWLTVLKKDLSKQIAKDLKKRGFKFLGPTTMYSFLQAAGFVNDHENDCSFK